MIAFSVGREVFMGIDGVVLMGIVLLVGMAVTEGKKGGRGKVGVRVFEVGGAQARYAKSVVIVCVPLTRAQDNAIGRVLSPLIKI